MKAGKTVLSGEKTHRSASPHSRTDISGKDPNYDYAFRRHADIDGATGMDMYGYVPVGKDNYSGETWSGPKSMQQRSKGASQIRFDDVILCKRDKETSRYFKAQEDERYNSQIRLVQSASSRARAQLRAIDPDAVVVDEAKPAESAARLTQRPGPTIKEPEDANVIEVDEDGETNSVEET